MCNGKKRHPLKERKDRLLEQIRVGKNEGLPRCLDGHWLLQ